MSGTSEQALMSSTESGPPCRNDLQSTSAGSQSGLPNRVVHLQRFPNASADVICLGDAVRNPPLEAFVKELRLVTIGEDDDVLKLPDGTWLGGTRDRCFLNGQFLIRQCYKELKNALMRMSGSRCGHNFLVLGSPGIGKSIFIYYMLHALMEEQKNEKAGEESSIVWQPEGRSFFVRITATKTYLANDLSAVSAELRKASTWYLVDGKPPERFDAITLLVCTPDKRIWKAFEKYSAVTLYMPVWTWKEMKTARERGMAHRFDSTELTLSEMKACFKKWGGIPSFVFQYARKPDVQASLVRAIKKLDVPKLCAFTGDTDGDDVLHSVLHVVAISSEVDWNMSYEMDFASSYVRQLVFNRLRQYDQKRVTQFIEASRVEPMSSSFRALLFEAYMHHLLCSAREFTVRKLSTSTGTEHFTVKFVANRFDFGRWADVINIPDRYYVPTRRNCPSIDSLIYPNSLFQMSVSETHAIDATGLVEVVNHMVPSRGPDEEAKEEVKLMYFFVAPADKFDSFKLQDYTIKGKVVPPPAFKAGVSLEQYVLKADITSTYLNGTDMYTDDESESEFY